MSAARGHPVWDTGAQGAGHNAATIVFPQDVWLCHAGGCAKCLAQWHSEAVFDKPTSLCYTRPRARWSGVAAAPLTGSR